MSDWVKVGSVGVDSGQVIITDPCYLSAWVAEDYDDSKVKKSLALSGKDRPYSYNGACAASMTEERAGVLGDGKEGYYESVCASSGYGDGDYPVFARYGAEGRIKELHIVFF